jgi:hypothetical protein
MKALKEVQIHRCPASGNPAGPQRAMKALKEVLWILLVMGRIERRDQVVPDLLVPVRARRAAPAL